jgi:intracellular sulfur oxidation DsrE/DsrF family protein
MSDHNKFRRYFLRLSGLLGAGLISRSAVATHTESHLEDKAKHRLVYQCNKADPEYIDHVLFSCGEILRKYGDDIELVVGVIGAGMHLLGKKPGKPISKEQQERVASLANYGVAFHACGNTMKSLNWTEKDILDIATVVPIGVDDLMLLQEKGFSYFSW